MRHHGLPRGVEPGQQDCRFHLGRGHGQAIADGHGIAGAAHHQGQAVAGPSGKTRAHLAQGLDHPAHGPAAQAGIAGEDRGDRVRGNDAHEQARAGSRVPEIEHVLGLHQPADAPADDAPDAGLIATRLGAERPHGRSAAQHVLALQQAMDLGFTHRQRPHHQRAMRDGFVPRHAGTA